MEPKAYHIWIQHLDSDLQTQEFPLQSFLQHANPVDSHKLMSSEERTHSGHVHWMWFYLTSSEGINISVERANDKSNKEISSKYLPFNKQSNWMRPLELAQKRILWMPQ